MEESPIKLELGTYSIPENCVVRAKNGILTIRESHKIIVTGYRCKDCMYFSLGHAVKGCSWYNTKVCLKKPKSKRDLNGGMLYFTVKPYGKICNNFKLKENESTSTEQP